MAKYAYSFGGGTAEGRTGMKELLGGKGANLAEMAHIGLPVPPGFTITTEVCIHFMRAGGKYPADLTRQVRRALARVETLMGRKFGDPREPLLFSVRSGARKSMPGMMETVLNIGLTSKTIDGLAASMGNNARLAWDAYRRLITMYSDVVMEKAAGLEPPEGKGIRSRLEHAMDALKKKRRVKLDTQLTADDLKTLCMTYRKLVKKVLRKPFPDDPMEQLWGGIGAVFQSWNGKRAVTYRNIEGIPHDWGTAVNVQAMVFGNSGNDSATGVAFTRDPATGEHQYFYGEYLLNAQGEDVVAGIRTPQEISKQGSRDWARNQNIAEKTRRELYPSLEETMPRVFRQLDGIRRKLERHYRDMQDIEFTIERGTLYMLQTRTGKRTAAAHVKIAVDMAEEGLIDEREAVLRVPPGALDQLLHPVFDAASEKKAELLTRGLPASPGAATGQVVFNADAAEEWAAEGRTVILARIETSPEDIGGMNAARGILTARGGMTSHAAVVARGMGKCCVAGAGEVVIDYASHSMTVGGRKLKRGDWISLNGSTGALYAGRIATHDPQLTGPFGTIMDLADKYRRLGVRTNADTPHDAEVAVRFGAEGIGLTRTEHMFFEGDRIISFRRLILVAETVKTLRDELKAAGDNPEAAKKVRKKLAAPLKQYNRALAELLPLQQKDFEGIFRALKGRPCTIRLLDPPLHEFLPHDDAGQKEMSRQMDVPVKEIKALVEKLHEFNPMLGHRGCRLGITYPEVTAMQARAIIQAALNVRGARPEIMVPLIGHVTELALQKEVILETIEDIRKKRRLKKLPFKVLIGTMIEIPRAAVTADEVAEVAEFFSFGTNDLTQMGCGFSRDDAGKFLGDYVRLGIYEKDPFQVLDRGGVGKLVDMATRLGRRTRPTLKVGICGEHGGEPASVEFCHMVGLDYVSCSPYRVPIARLAAAQAAIRDKAAKKPARRRPKRRK